MSDLVLKPSQIDELNLLMALGISEEEAMEQLSLEVSEETKSYKKPARPFPEGARVGTYYKKGFFQWNLPGADSSTVETFNNKVSFVKGLRGIVLPIHYYNELFVNTDDGWHVCQTEGYTSPDKGFVANLPTRSYVQYEFYKNEQKQWRIDDSKPNAQLAELGLVGTKNGDCTSCILAGKNRVMGKAVEGQLPKESVCKRKAYVSMIVFAYAVEENVGRRQVLKWHELGQENGIPPFIVHLNMSPSAFRSFKEYNVVGLKDYLTGLQEQDKRISHVFTEFSLKKIKVDAAGANDGVGLHSEEFAVKPTRAQIMEAGQINMGEADMIKAALENYAAEEAAFGAADSEEQEEILQNANVAVTPLKALSSAAPFGN